MKIIEQLVVPKNDKQKSEDGIVITDNFVAVIDGSTSKSTRQLSRWRSNGRYAMKIIADYIKHADKSVDVARFCREVTAAVRKKYGKKDLERLAVHPEDRLCASCVVFSRLRREVWMIGDCQCLIGDTLYDNPKPGEAPIAAIRAERAQQLLDDGTETVESLRENDVAREAIIPALVEGMKGENVDYAVVDGFDIPLSKVRVLTLNFEPWTVVLASDGYPFLRPTLEESERLLQQQLHDDPLNIHAFKATKAWRTGNNSFDDRSYVRLEV